ncbi:hypothetical protein [Chryseosolibacter indicus]|uniref:Uncharacterized protein n=1 Tax=Chryseosolibacter indicus TaxID=2782351 RepID=A0ABS5VWQ8_9BACT|nr:hypothetical protein [Chryseosolibacter indicus]MBT1705314.1 hypothetical protein [Chryseosolibacter indicus]
MEELSSEEASSTNGGESLWYWVAYGVGAIGRGMEAFRSGAAYSSEHMPGLK